MNICDMCGRPVAVGCGYIVNIEIVTDPRTADINDEDEAAAAGGGDAIKELIEQMGTMSAEQLEAQVHEKLERLLCQHCRALYAANPMPNPRPPMGRN